MQTVVEDAGFSVVRSLVGHGVGRYYHEDPHIPNFGDPGRGPRLSEGMTIAVEPMITAGGPEITIADDGWTISTEDGSLAAHFEHTIAITPEGPRVLTPRVGVPRVMRRGREADASGRGRGFRREQESGVAQKASCYDDRPRCGAALLAPPRVSGFSLAPTLRLPSNEVPMKVRPSVKPMCERCRVIKRHGRTIVICSNPRHKQRQG